MDKKTVYVSGYIAIDRKFISDNQINFDENHYLIMSNELQTYMEKEKDIRLFMNKETLFSEHPINLESNIQKIYLQVVAEVLEKDLDSFEVTSTVYAKKNGVNAISFESYRNFLNIINIDKIKIVKSLSYYDLKDFIYIELAKTPQRYYDIINKRTTLSDIALKDISSMLRFYTFSDKVRIDLQNKIFETHSFFSLDYKLKEYSKMKGRKLKQAVNQAYQEHLVNLADCEEE